MLVSLFQGFKRGGMVSLAGVVPGQVKVGGGMAGLSAAAELSSHARVALVERESQPGYHATGRSAALYSELYGNAAIRALTRASRGFYFEPPAGFAAYPLVSPRETMYFAGPDEAQIAVINNVRALTQNARSCEASGALPVAICPATRARAAAGEEGGGIQPGFHGARGPEGSAACKPGAFVRGPGKPAVQPRQHGLTNRPGRATGTAGRAEVAKNQALPGKSSPRRLTRRARSRRTENRLATAASAPSPVPWMTPRSLMMSTCG